MASLTEDVEDLEFEALLRRKDGSIFMGESHPLPIYSQMVINGELYNLSIIGTSRSA